MTGEASRVIEDWPQYLTAGLLGLGLLSGLCGFAPVLGQMLGWLGVLVVIGSGLDRSLLAAVVRSFRTVPVGQAVIQAKTGVALVMMAGGIFLAGLQLAAPVMSAALAVEVTIALI